MTDIDKLAAEMRAGLEGVTPGPWFKSGVRFRMGGGEWHSIARYDDLKKTDVGVAIVGFDPRTGEGMADANWIARCSPDNIASILDDRDLLAAVVAEARRADVLIAALEFYANPAVNGRLGRCSSAGGTIMDNVVLAEILKAHEDRTARLHAMVLDARDAILTAIKSQDDPPVWMREAFDKLHAVHHGMGGDPFQMHMRAAVEVACERLRPYP